MSTTRIAGITVEQHDRTRAFLLLHGGAGVPTVRSFAALLAERAGARVLVPRHPGFGGVDRPDSPTTTRDLAAAYADLLDRLDLTGVTVVGNSFGGWVAAELALLGSPRVTEAVVVDGIGIEVDGHPLTDVRGLSPQELRALSFHDPAKAPGPQSPGPQAPGAPGPSPDVRALLAYAGPTMSDPTLLGRLAATEIPVHVVWGASDGIVDVGYGRAYAAAIPGARFTVLPDSGHLPQVETPEALLAALLDG
ncbi:alpha/beta hydrolase [Actinosynnema pretiosum subsp. pretiosum]|uniref:Alpha/beta hydrolase n=1 Tax=Actinosynnema pretiosum subsp. pretiosum TaxID=103721 RepID=A0AA45R3Z3_9PSEU|nr:N-formylglutamate deformylase [Actinosynnema pretiosum subsp. pretiosum]QUF04351.1 alpha/beta hydrolase [Actinosynnema pretiosum subsp. pretiosum]